MSTIPTRSLVATAGVALAAAGAVLVSASSASAATFTLPMPDLVAAGPNAVVVFDNSGAELMANVTNNGSSAPTSKVSFEYQPVGRFYFQGSWQYYNLGSPTRATGAVPALAAGQTATVRAHVPSTSMPSGLHRITVCADSTGLVKEKDESNNCRVEYANVQPSYIG